MKHLIKYSFGSALFGAAVLGGLGGLNLYTYKRFTEESVVATLTFESVADSSYRVTIVPVDRPAFVRELAGDEWQLDVRMIKWTDWLTFLGESPLYRLDRLSGRDVSLEDERSKKRTMYALGEESGIDVWSFARTAGDWLPGVDAAYGSSVYLPMTDGLSYEVSMSRTGLLARQIEGTE